MYQALLTVDLGFGDAGKGSIVDFLARAHDAHTVVRYNGGAQAAHRVVTSGPQPREHVFAQFGSGTLAGAATHLSRFMLVEPLALLAEAQHLGALGVGDVLQRTTIDAHALIITPFQRAANQIKELVRGAARHGSCGMGIGETMADYVEHGARVLLAGDLHNRRVLNEKLEFLRAVNMAKVRALLPTLPDDEPAARALELLHDDTRWFADVCHDLVQSVRVVPNDHLHSILARPGTVIFEGAQGVLLDEWHGFHPHTTWSTTTLANAERLLAEAGYAGDTTRIGITRAYSTRHGAGPLVSEDAELTRALPDPRNGTGAWQQHFRVGWLDLVLLRYALEVVGPLDMLAVTCLDRLAALPQLQVCRSYRHDGDVVERIAPSPVARDLAYQEQLTGLLACCEPLLDTLPDADALLGLLRRELGLPICIVSAGSTAADKRLLDPLRGILQPEHSDGFRRCFNEMLPASA